MGMCIVHGRVMFDITTNGLFSLGIFIFNVISKDHSWDKINKWYKNESYNQLSI